MIKVGYRQSFDRLEEVGLRYSNLKAPIELAFPYYWKIYDPIRPHLPEIAEKLKSYKAEVLSVHAVQAPISREGFRVWGKEAADFAKCFGAKTVTVHPNKTNHKQEDQIAAFENLRFLNGIYDGEIVFSIETFEGHKVAQFILSFSAGNSMAHSNRSFPRSNLRSSINSSCIASAASM